MKTNKVFIPHAVLIKKTDGTMDWKFDIERIKRAYGSIEPVVSSSQMMLTPDVCFSVIRQRFVESGFDPKTDYFLAAGDMTVYGAMLLIAANEYGQSPKQLRHSKRYDSYDVLPYIDWRKSHGN